ncbi:hypothetical protein CUJ89_15285 [Burkholderia pyrrocinia]|uniref:Uncharacterized protein n=1 Tax=Burkholderia pyrrocinia TaxID=60550 RepID=A0A2Z5MYW4_BURPY|nr:hypothetical protein CUJ89_15285 [Burkholderia pyrrocinia]
MRWPPEGPSARNATKRILDVFARSMTRRSALLVASPTNEFSKTGERAVPATLRRRSSLVWHGQTALLTPCMRPAGSPLGGRPARHVRKPVISGNRP